MTDLRQAAQGTYKKRGSIALARSLCYQINGAADDSDDIDGGGYGSVDIAEILSAEVVRLQKALTQPAQEPTPWRDMAVVTLVREGIDKHRARELADHFAAQPESCQTCVEIHSLLDADESMIIRNARDGYPEGRTPRELTLLARVKALCKYAADWKRWCIEAQTPPAAQPEQKPVACRFCHSEKGCWTWQCYDCGEIDDVQKPPAAQRPWVGLTETDWEEIDDKKDTALDSFAQGAVWAANQLRRRNA